MNDKETPRSIRFPLKLWAAIDEDAKRCKRSSVKQMEAILSSYYRTDNIELDFDRLSQIRNGETDAVEVPFLPGTTKEDNEQRTRERRKNGTDG